MAPHTHYSVAEMILLRQMEEICTLSVTHQQLPPPTYQQKERQNEGQREEERET